MKFITRELLPCFKDIPVLDGDFLLLFGEIRGKYQSAITLQGNCTLGEFIMAKEYADSMYKAFQKCYISQKLNDDWYLDSFELLNVLPDLQYPEDIPQLQDVIKEVEYLFSSYRSVFFNQGGIADIDNLSCLPKLILISEAKFDEWIQNAGRLSDLTPLYEKINYEMRYEMFVQGEQMQSDWGISVRKILCQDTDKFAFTVDIINYARRQYVSMKVHGNDTIMCNPFEVCRINNHCCTRCKTEKGINICQADYFYCPARRLETAITACVLLREYLYIKDARKHDYAKPNASEEDAVQKFFFDGIAVYDYCFDGEEKWRERNGGTGKTGTAKRPHVRQGTWRFNPNTGEKDIYVRSSVIHIEKYKGYETSDRIV